MTTGKETQRFRSLLDKQQCCHRNEEDGTPKENARLYCGACADAALVILLEDQEKLEAERAKLQVSQQSLGEKVSNLKAENERLEGEIAKMARHGGPAPQLDRAIVLLKEARSQRICGCKIPCENDKCGCFACDLDRFLLKG